MRVKPETADWFAFTNAGDVPTPAHAASYQLRALGIHNESKGCSGWRHPVRVAVDVP